MATKKQREEIDTIVSFILIKKLVTPITRTDAYKMKLVNSAGRVIREPKTDKENAALTLLDRVVFKLKRLLTTKIANLNNFLYTVTLTNDFYNKLVVRGSIRQRAEIQKIMKDVSKLSEEHNISVDELVEVLLHDNAEKMILEN